MTTLLDCQIVMACAQVTPETRARAALLERAGAHVRSCGLAQDLWSTLSEGPVDAILVQLDQPDPAALAIFDQLRNDARTRGALRVLLTANVSLASARCAVALSTSLAEHCLVKQLSDLLVPLVRVRESEQQERALRDQLRRESGHAEHLTRELAELAHESRSNLSAILGLACNLRDELTGPLTGDQRTHVLGIIEAVERTTNLLHRARMPSTPAHEQRPSSPARGAQRLLIPLARLTEEVAALFGALATRKHQQVRCELDPSVRVWGEPLKLKQVVTNLLVNAIKYTPEGGQVTLRVYWSAGGTTDSILARRSAVIEVADTGPGIAPEHRAQVFVRGFRVGAVPGVEGEGIGLSVVDEIVTQHGGSVSVGGEVGRGSVFTVRLPQDRRQRGRSGPLTEP